MTLAIHNPIAHLRLLQTKVCLVGNFPHSTLGRVVLVSFDDLNFCCGWEFEMLNRF